MKTFLAMRSTTLYVLLVVCKNSCGKLHRQQFDSLFMKDWLPSSVARRRLPIVAGSTCGVCGSFVCALVADTWVDDVT